MISPKYSLTNYFYPSLSSKTPPNVVNLYFDYNCPFSARLYVKLQDTVIPQLQEKHADKFQFVYVNVVQPWHPNSVLLNEFALVVGKLLREKGGENTNKLFWDVSRAIYDHKEHFYDQANVELNRNEIYKQIAKIAFSKVKLPFSENDVLDQLTFKQEPVNQIESNPGNGATTDLKYFTKYLRNVGVHVTPTVSVNGIIADSVSSGTEPNELVKVFESFLG
ncbi:hypothetical protein PGUG_01626 [Meyerozyma guilliermondii ATCC 6260]|uniref:Uncharacterized protein n=1 Tax=Meyerozyma guilliermondii (strain ATCC 6260 / CBS 566 / DSM 6381 / JCM 1539 / NBRC 10279 / NRRL Y-324) TaxID=294746 RepID=A5DEC5_PICGU|nr:uncharacterized protein PGUG_01626 [Meyerozyma guilliermondii ATCC 6260]EDK37528.2 hypothetical protein PGUG_01626 [Meyerozyma guilliermondii ATCC 6260]